MAMPERQRTNGYLGPAEETYRLSDIPPRRTPPAGHDSQTTSLHKAEPFLDPDFNINPSSTNPHFAWQSDPVDKLLLLCASIYLLVRTVTDRRSTGPLLAFVSSNRATAQIVVSINSAILAGLNVYTATKLLNFATRIHLLGQSLTLAMLKFIEAVATRRLVSGVPAAMCTTSVVMVPALCDPQHPVDRRLDSHPHELYHPGDGRSENTTVLPRLKRDLVKQRTHLRHPMYHL